MYVVTKEGYEMPTKLGFTTLAERDAAYRTAEQKAINDLQYPVAEAARKYGTMVIVPMLLEQGTTRRRTRRAGLFSSKRVLIPVEVDSYWSQESTECAEYTWKNGRGAVVTLSLKKGDTRMTFTFSDYNMDVAKELAQAFRAETLGDGNLSYDFDAEDQDKCAHIYLKPS